MIHSSQGSFETYIAGLAMQSASTSTSPLPDTGRTGNYVKGQPALSSIMICTSTTASNNMSTFDTLPLEILFRIFDFIISPQDLSSSQYHPLNSLAATSKLFDSAVEEYTRALLKRHANFAPRKKSKTYTSRKKWLAEICQLCYKKSKRRSTLWGNLTCCLACDKKHFPKVVCLDI